MTRGISRMNIKSLKKLKSKL